MKKRTLDALRFRKAGLEQKIAARVRLFAGLGTMWLKSWLIAMLIKPRQEDAKVRDWSGMAKERIAAYTAAVKERDILKAARNGHVCREVVDAEKDGATRYRLATVLDYIDDSRELAGLTEVLGWLRCLEDEVEKDDVFAVFNSFVHLGVCCADSCDCGEFGKADDDIDRSPSLVWMHRHHTEFNRAAWEIIAAKPGMIKALRRALNEDLRGPMTVYEDNRVFGEVISHRYARELLRFFVRENPSPAWVGELVPVSADTVREEERISAE